MDRPPPRSVILGVTGASGAPIALKLFHELARRELTIHLIFSNTARHIFASETATRPELAPLLAGVSELKAKTEFHSPDDFAAPIASGSNPWDAMVVCPASMGTLARIAAGNPASERLHELFGFQRIGVLSRIGWKLGRWHDLGFWQLTLRDDDDAPAPIRPVSEVLRSLEDTAETKGGRPAGKPA